MSIKPVNQTENYVRKTACAQGRTIVECRFSQSNEISEIVAVHPSVSLNSCNVSDGRVDYTGKLVCTVVYVDEEGKLCRIQKGAEFTHYIENEQFKNERFAQCTLSAEKAQIKRDGSSFVITSVVAAKVSVYATEKREYLCDIDGAICNIKREKFTSAVWFSGESEVSDDFEADGIVDVLLPQAQAYISDCTAGDGEIKISGEICLSLLAMRGDSAVSLDRVIAYNAVLACDKSRLSANACACVQVKELSVNATVNEDRAKCLIEIDCVLDFDGVFFQENENSVVVDAFSVSNELQLNGAVENSYSCTQFKTTSQRISAPVICDAKIDYTCSFKAVACPKVEYEYEREKDLLQGAIYFVLIYEQNGEIKSCNVEMPFSQTTKFFDVEFGGEVALQVAVCGLGVRQQTEGGCVAEAVLKASACAIEESQINYVISVAEGEATQKNDSAITVFIPSANDGVWEVAKHLKKSPDEVIAENPDLSFPTTGEERILVYRAKKY